MNWRDLILAIAVLACPIMHILMMRGMHKNHDSNNDHVHNNNGKKDETKSCH